MKTSDLKHSAFNPRKITDKRLEMLKKSMAEFGDLSGIVFNVRTGRLVGGHQRTRLFDPSWPIIKKPCKDKLGTLQDGYVDTPHWGRWSYREVSWTPKREALANIAANQHGGEFDMPKLKEIIVEIDDGSIDMELTGFNRHELGLSMTATPPEENAGSGSGKGEIVSCPSCGHKFSVLRKVE